MTRPSLGEGLLFCEIPTYNYDENVLEVNRRSDVAAFLSSMDEADGSCFTILFSPFGMRMRGE